MQIEATQAWLIDLVHQIKTMPKEMQLLRLGGPTALLKAQATKTFEYCARYFYFKIKFHVLMISGKRRRYLEVFRTLAVEKENAWRDCIVMLEFGLLAEEAKKS